MSLLHDVGQSLREMTLLHLLLAFLAFIGYMLAEGQLASRRVRIWGGVIAFLSVVWFVFDSPQWTINAMLVAIAVGVLGMFSAIVWATSAALGLRSVGANASSANSANAADAQQLAAGDARAVLPPASPGTEHALTR